MSSRSPWSRTTGIALGVALAWSLLLVVAAFVVPVYGTASGSATVDPSTGLSTTTTEITGSATLVGVNGPGVLVVIGIPLVATLLVGWALAARRRRIGWVITSALCVLNVLALLSVGIFFVPTTLALIVACAATERRRVAHPADEPSSLGA